MCKTVYQFDEFVKEEFPKKPTISNSENPEARKGYKLQDYSFLGCKIHLSMSDERIITVAVVTSGEKGSGSYLAELMEKRKVRL